jgi:hypothetical protein
MQIPWEVKLIATLLVEEEFKDIREILREIVGLKADEVAK